MELGQLAHQERLDGFALFAQAAALQGKSLGELQKQVYNEAQARTALSGGHSQLETKVQTLETTVRSLTEELEQTASALRDESKLRVRLQETVEAEQGKRAALETRMKLMEVAVRDNERARQVDGSELRTSNTNLQATHTHDHQQAMDALAEAKHSLQSAIDANAERSAHWQSSFRQELDNFIADTFAKDTKANLEASAAKVVVEERLRRLDDDLRASLRNTAEAVEGEAAEREQTRLAVLEAVGVAGKDAAKEVEKLNAALRREAAARAEGDASVAATCTLLQQLCAELKAEDKEAGLRLSAETGAVGEQLRNLQSRLDVKLSECSTDMGGLRTRLEQHAQEVREVTSDTNALTVKLTGLAESCTKTSEGLAIERSVRERITAQVNVMEGVIQQLRAR